ncbi:hypothetical protein [Aeoliella sp.]|uniref:hypothetical protein n=1 Tax=Aeoliella sp. TaxID=2795800 RepID=UPI003CCC37D7
MMTNKLRLLALGDRDDREFTTAIERLAGETFVEMIDDQHDGPFELAMVFQSRPGTFDRKRIEQLHDRMPLAGMAVLLGSWCEGEMRTGAPLPHCERVFWYQFDAWWQTVRTAWLARRPTPWQRPAQTNGELAQLTGAEVVAIDSTDADTADALIDACEAMGACGVWSPRFDKRPLSTAPAAGVWVGAQLDATEERQLADFRETLPEESPLVVLLDFPRRDRVRRAMELGATSVLGKPWRLEQLAELVATRSD